MRSLSMLRAIAGMAALNGPMPLDNANPSQKDMYEGRKSGRPKKHKDRTKPIERDKEYIRNRHKKLPIFLEELRLKRHLQNRINKYNKSHRTKKQQEVYDDKIVHITAQRFNLSQGQQFPLEAIIIMADSGVVEAKKQYHRLAESAEQLDISVRKAYDHFVFGKEIYDPT